MGLFTQLLLSCFPITQADSTFQEHLPLLHIEMIISNESEPLDCALSLCSTRDIAGLQRFLAQNPQLLVTGFQSNKNRRYLLHEVIVIGDIDIFRCLIEYAWRMGQLIDDLFNHLDRTPLTIAIIHDRREILQILQSKIYNIDINNDLSHSLDLAAEHNSINVYKLATPQ